MHGIEIALVIIIYVMIVFCSLFTILFTKNILGNQKSFEPIKKTIHVVALVLGIYFIPIIGLGMCLVNFEQAIGLTIGVILLSVFPVTKYIIIPIIDNYKNK